MKIQDVLRRKGGGVATVGADDSVSDIVQRLAELGVGALVVSNGNGAVDGIVSERDVVRRLRTDGGAALDLPVSAIMTADVRTCTPATPVEDLMRLMTDFRIRHVPVVDEDGSLVGIVSIGDVVKQRMDELQAERDQLVVYING